MLSNIKCIYIQNDQFIWIKEKKIKLPIIVFKKFTLFASLFDYGHD